MITEMCREYMFENLDGKQRAERFWWSYSALVIRLFGFEFQNQK